MHSKRLLIAIPFLSLACRSLPSASPTRTQAARPAEAAAPSVSAEDIPRFWAAYDTVRTLSDTAAQHTAFRRIYIAPGSPGLVSLMQARRYTAEQYVAAITNYPRFWQSVRANTLRAPSHALAIDRGIARLRVLYPALRPAQVYFAIGALRTNGTTLDGRVLIGAELALADSTAVTDELPANSSHLRPFFNANPARNVVQLNVHEVVHTQQRAHPYRLLHRSLYEGIAEYVSVYALGTLSSAPAIAYGRANRVRVRDRFAQQLLSPAAIDEWLYNSVDNEFGVRDLGYYVGYAIAEGVVARAADASAAIATLIELDYTDPVALASIVDAAGYFARPLRDEIARYEASRPTVVRLREVQNGDTLVSAALTRLTIEFSAPMAREERGFEFGPLGEAHVLRVEQWGGFASDGRSATITVAMAPGQRYQLLLTERFRDLSGVPMRAHLVDFTTARSSGR